MRTLVWMFVCSPLLGCYAPRPVEPPVWELAVDAALADARGSGRDAVVMFTRADDVAIDRMVKLALPDPTVHAALRAGRFVAAQADGQARDDLYARWIGTNERTGFAIVDPFGRCYAARPGPQDPPELAAFLRLVASQRAAIAAARHRLAAAPDDPKFAFELGRLLLELGCRIESRELLRTAAAGAVPEARHLLARLFALDGFVAEAKEWLIGTKVTPGARVTVGYLLFKEQRYLESARVLQDALQLESATALGADLDRARLYLGKSLHMAERDDDAVPILEALATERPDSLFAAAARHTLEHIADPRDDHTH